MLALLTSAINPPEWMKKTIPMQAHLALRMKADYHVIQNDKESSTNFERANFFTKLRAIERLLSGQARYERIVWLDADVMPNPFLIGDADIKLLTESRNFSLAIDPIKTLAGRFMNWLPRSGLAPSDKIKPEANYYNAGIFAIDRAGAELLVARYRETINHNPGPFFDQDLINYIIATDEMIVDVLPRDMNWMSAHHNLDESFRKGKLLHFAGAQKHLIAPAARFLSPF